MTQNYWDRLRGAQSRRSFLSGSAVTATGIAAAGLIGCSTGSKPATATPPSGTATTVVGPQSYDPLAMLGKTDYMPPGVKRGGEFVMHLGSPLTDVLDPGKSQTAASWVYALTSNQGLRMNANQEIIPELFASWEQPSPTEIIMKVQPDAKWQAHSIEQGRNVTAEDAAYNLMRIGGLLDTPANRALYPRATILSGMSKAEAVDAKTVKVTFSEPRSTFLRGITDYRTNFLSKQRLEAANFKPETLAGSGPFILKKWDANVEIVFEKNPDYWKKGRPFLDRFKWVVIPDFNSAATAFAQGKLSAISTLGKVPRQTVEKLLPTAVDYTWQQGTWRNLRFQVTRKPFDDVRVRNALFLALNFAQINEPLYGDKWDYTGPVPSPYKEALQGSKLKTMPGFNSATKDADIAKAKQLMAAAGFPDGELNFKLFPNSNTGDYVENAVRAKDQWQKVWPKMNVTLDPPADGTAGQQRLGRRDFDVSSSDIYPVPDAVLEVDAAYGSTGSRNYGAVNDPKVDDMLKKAYVALDPKVRQEAITTMETYLLEQQYIITLAVPMFTYKLQPNVEGLIGTYASFSAGALEGYRHQEHIWFK